MTKNLFIIAMALLVLTPTSLGWGIANPYISENPIIIKAGETGKLTLEVQNMQEEHLSIKLNIENISASSLLGVITEDTYDMPAKTRRDINIQLTTKKLTPSGNYTLVLHAKATPVDKEKGQVGISGATKTTINIQVINPVMDVITSPVTITITLIMIIGIIALVYLRKRYGKKAKGKR